MKIKEHLFVWVAVLIGLAGLCGCSSDDETSMVSPEEAAARKVIDAAFNNALKGNGRWLYGNEYPADECTYDLKRNIMNVYYWTGEPLEITDTMPTSLFENIARKVMTREQAYEYIRVAEDNSMWYKDHPIFDVVGYVSPTGYFKSFLVVDLSAGTTRDELKSAAEKIGSRLISEVSSSDSNRFYDYVYVPMDSRYNVFEAAKYIYGNVGCDRVYILGGSFIFADFYPEEDFRL